MNGVWIAGDYDHPLVASLIKTLKYKFVSGLSPVLGEYLALFLKSLSNRSRLTGSELCAGGSWRRIETLAGPVRTGGTPAALLDLPNTLVMPVPLHRRRQRWRGFNQAELIAAKLMLGAGLGPPTPTLICVKHKKPQAKLTEALRKTNILGCYAYQGERLGGRHVILIDDVVTTGSTLNECARVLKSHGAGEVWGLVVAKG